MINKIDLHIHTTCSDGVLSPKEVIDRAKKNGVSIIAITDHDTINAYQDELYQYAKTKNIRIINGVEISTRVKKTSIHVLGYNININNKNLKDRLSSSIKSRHDYLYNVATKLKDLGYIINVKELEKIESVTKAHIALDILNNKENKKLLIKNFKYLPNMGEFIETVMNEGCPGYAEKKSITPKEAADMIKNAGGKVVLAHPVAYTYEENLSETDILNIINDMKADGIETYYLYIDRYNKKTDDSDKWKVFADKNNLFKTIGSDYHLSDGLRPEIGLNNINFKLSNSDIQEIITNLTL